MIPVAAAVIYRREKLLIARRAGSKHLAGYWEFPGGKIELGETPEECLVREVQEELGISIIVESFLQANLHDYGNKKVLLKAYRCKYLTGDMVLIDHDDAQWILPEQLSKYELAPADIPFVAALVNGLP
jgi:8-oxo-dGTP diphosphatase